MASWTDEDKAKAIAAYKAKNPTPENSMEIVKELAEEMEQSPNGVRMVLSQAGVYVKKDATAGKPAKDGEKAEGTKRVSKESQISALRAEIENIGAKVDDEILEKLTGKAAAYFVTVLQHSK